MPAPSGAEAEVGEIPAASEPTVVVLDEEEEAAAAGGEVLAIAGEESPGAIDGEVPAVAGEGSPAAAGVSEAGQVVVVAGPPVTTEPGAESVPLNAGEEGRVAEGFPAESSASRKRRAEPGSSSHPLAPRPTRPRVEGAQGGVARQAPMIKPMHDAVQATNLVTPLRTDEFKREMEGLTGSDILDMIMVAVVQIANGALSMREAHSIASAKLSRALARVNKHKAGSQAQAESNARLQEELRVLGGRLRETEGRAKTEENRAVAAEARCELVLGKLRIAGEENKVLERQLKRAEEEGKKAGEEIKALERRLERAEEEGKKAGDEARTALERAAAAEKAAAEANAERAGAVACADEACARAEEAGNRAFEAEAKAKEAEDKVHRLEVEAGRILSDYKTSADFKQEVLEGSLDAYLQGFAVCKAKVSDALGINIAELEGICPEAADDEEPADEEGGDKGEPADEEGGDKGEPADEEGGDKGEPGPGEP